MPSGFSRLVSRRGAPRMDRLRARILQNQFLRKVEPLKNWSKEHIRALSSLSPEHLTNLSRFSARHLDVFSSLSAEQLHLLGSFSPEYLAEVRKLKPEEFNAHMVVLQNLSMDEVGALGEVSPRFRKPFIRGLPEMVAWDLARWEGQEKPEMASSGLEVKYGLEKGGGPKVPSTGGDSSDLIPLDERNIFMTMLDFSGKGASANEPRGMFQGFLRGHISAGRTALKSLRKEISRVMKLNHGISTRHLDRILLAVCNSAERTHNQHFPEVNSQGLTGYFQLRPKEKKVLFRYVHMGHEPIYVLRRQRDGGYKLEEHGLDSDGASTGRWFGKLSTFASYTGADTGPFRKIHQIPLHVGDKLLTYTDGLSEARNRDGDMFGYDRIQKLLLDNAHMSAADLTALLKDAREKHLYLPKYAPDDMRIRVFEVKQQLLKPEPSSKPVRWQPAFKKSGGWPSASRQDYRTVYRQG